MTRKQQIPPHARAGVSWYGLGAVERLRLAWGLARCICGLLAPWAVGGMLLARYPDDEPDRRDASGVFQVADNDGHLRAGDPRREMTQQEPADAR